LQTQFKYFIVDSFIPLKRAEYILLFIIPLMMLEYITLFFKRKHNMLYYLYYFLTALSLSAIIISGDISVWNRVLLYIVEPVWIIPIGVSGYICVRELKNDIDAKYILATFPIIWLMFLNDILIFRGVYDFISLSNYGFLLVIIGTGIVMRKRYLRLHSDAETLRVMESWRTSISSETKVKLDSVIAYLKENYTSDISREGLAGFVGINPDYLGKAFKIYTGKKISDYINELRIARSSEMLRNSKESIIDIAYSSGFESLSTFYRIFQKVLGEAPNTYRDRHNK
jgi:AraC-like DNA-binding protein